MKKKLRFNIGDWVSSEETMCMGYNKNDKIIVKHKKPIVGQIAGLKRFMLGKRFPESTTFGHDGEPDYGQAYLQVTSTVMVWEVKIGWLNKIVYVLQEDINPAQSAKLPMMFQEQCPWSQAAREEMRKEAASMDRDSKGRFLPYNYKEIVSGKDSST